MTTRNPTRPSKQGESYNSWKRLKTSTHQDVRRVNSMSLTIVPPLTCGRLWLASLFHRVLSRAFIDSPHVCRSRSQDHRPALSQHVFSPPKERCRKRKTNSILHHPGSHERCARGRIPRRVKATKGTLQELVERVPGCYIVNQSEKGSR